MEAGEQTGPGRPPSPKPVKTWMLRIDALEFKTDHGLIKDNDADWTQSGGLYPKPEWKRTPPANAPITHTRKKKVEAEGTFTVPLPTAETKSAKVEGRARIEGLSFKSTRSQSFGPGNEVKVPVKGKKKLPNLVGKLKVAVAWRAKADKYYPAASSGPHVVFVTYDKPIDTGLVEDGVTLRRMKKTMAWMGGAWAQGKKRPVDLIDTVFSKFSGYVLGFEMLSGRQRGYLSRNPTALGKLMTAGFATYMDSGQGGAWPLAEFVKYGGECQAIVRLTRAMAHQVGLPGKIEVKYVSSQPWDPYTSRVLDDPSIDPDGPELGFVYALVDAPVSVGREYGKRDGVGFNRYEAFLKYTHGKVTWFGGGIGRMPTRTKEKDLVKVFWGLAAVSAGGPDIGGAVKFRIERIWKYR